MLDPIDKPQTSDDTMHIFARPLLLVVAALPLLLTACGDVGEAPRARIGTAMVVTPSDGTPLAIDTTYSEISWRAAKVTRAHEGGFHVFDGTVTVRDDEVTGVDLTIDMPSIWSDTPDLTGHLKEPDFFDVALYPTARFTSSQIVPVDSTGATHLVTGNLTIRDTTRSLTFPATITIEDGIVRTEADFLIDRTAWGIDYEGKPDDLIERDVRLRFDVTAGTPNA